MSKVLSVEEQKEIQLNMLLSIHEYCSSNGLTYWLAYGTLLGAVRHKGYIPWDDDIDIAMPRNDYDIFLKNYHDKRNVNYKVVDIKNDPTYLHPFAKMIDNNTKVTEEWISLKENMGVYIDIFPIDNLSSNMEEAKKIMKIEKFYRHLLMQKIASLSSQSSLIKKWIRLIVKVLLCFTSPQKIIVKMDVLSKKYVNENTSTYCGAACSVYGEREIFRKTDLSQTVECKFEGHSFFIPKSYDLVLSQLYGDYMKLPPEEKRIPHHFLKAVRYQGEQL